MIPDDPAYRLARRLRTPTLGLGMGLRLGGAGAGVVRLNNLTASSAAVDEGTPPGQVVAKITGKRQGAALSLTDDAGGRFALGNINGSWYIVTGATVTAYASATSHNIQITQTLASAENSPRVSTITIAVNDVATDADAEAIIAAMTGLDSTRKWGIRQMVTKLKVSGFWATQDIIYITAAHSLAAAKINWKSPASFTLVEHGTTTGRFTVDQGFTGNGTDYYLDTTYNPTTSATNYALNSASIGAQCRNSVSDTTIDWGNGGARLQSKSGSAFLARLNTSTQISVAVDLSVGVSIATRRDSATQYGAKDGATPSSSASTSTSVSNSTFKMLGNVVAANWSTRQLSAAFAGGALSDAQMSAANEALVWWQKFVGQYTVTGLTPQTFSTDTATYGVMTSQQVPGLAVVGTRWFRLNYGINNMPPGTNGEQPPSYTRLSISDNRGASWTHAAFWLPTDVATSVYDPQAQALADGRLAILFTTSQKCYCVILQNPLASVGSFNFTAPRYLASGIAGRPRYRSNGALRFMAQDNPDSGTHLFPAGGGMKYCSLNVYGDGVVCEVISVAPPALPEATYSDFCEASINEIAGGNTRIVFRTQTGYWQNTATGDGVSWGVAAPLTAAYSVSSRADEARSPSGRLIFGNNNANDGVRKNEAISISTDDGATYAYQYTYDTRGSSAPRVSYSAIDFELDTNGDYTGYALIAYDCGRGRQDAPTYTNEIIVAIIPENAVASGNPSVTFSTVTT